MATQVRGDVDIKPLSITNASIAAGAGIVYSKLALTGSIVNADIVSLAWSKLTGTPTTLSGYGITSPLPLAQGGTATSTVFTAGSVVFAGVSGVYSQDNANLFWDDTNNRLGIGVASNLHGRVTVEAASDVVNSFETAGAIVVRSSTAFGINIGPQIRFSGRNTTGTPSASDPYAFATIAGRKENAVSADWAGYLQFSTTGAGSTITERMRITSDGLVGIGTVPTTFLDLARTSADIVVRAITTTSGISRYDVRGYGTSTSPAGNLHTSGAHIILSNKASTDGNYTTIFNQSNGGAQRTAIVFINDVQATDASSMAFLTHNGTALAERVRLDTAGRLGVGLTGPTAIVHIKAGTATANTAPLKLTSGTVLTTAEAGAIEFTTDDFFATITTAAARKAFVLDDGARLTSGKIPVASTNGRLIDGPTWGARQTYTETNVTTDRAYDANATTLDEIADVLGTLIADLRAKNMVA